MLSSWFVLKTPQGSRSSFLRFPKPEGHISLWGSCQIWIMLAHVTNQDTILQYSITCVYIFILYIYASVCLWNLMNIFIQFQVDFVQYTEPRTRNAWAWGRHRQTPPYPRMPAVPGMKTGDMW